MCEVFQRKKNNQGGGRKVIGNGRKLTSLERKIIKRNNIVKVHLQLHRQYLRIRTGLGCSYVARFVALDEAIAALVALLSGAAQDAAVAHVA